MKVKRFHLYAGLDLIGSKTSMAESRNVTLEATSIGIKMNSKATGRIVVIPYTNVKGFELYPESAKSSAIDSPSAVEAAPEITEAPKRRGRPPKQ
jgi:hypothetical protein